MRHLPLLPFLAIVLPALGVTWLSQIGHARAHERWKKHRALYKEPS
jgi:hypothetical protein